MDTHTKLDNTDLSRYYFAVRWGIACIQMRIDTAEKNGWGSKYDRHQLEILQDLEQFLKMSYDVWMDALCQPVAEGVTCG